MATDFYSESMPYEFFIRRAFKCQRQMRNGADISFMQNLMRTEAGSSSVSHLPDYDKQQQKVSAYILKAIDRFLTFKLTDEEREKLLRIRQKLQIAYGSAALMEIVEAGLEATHRFR
jgi:hypothetical protein